MLFSVGQIFPSLKNWQVSGQERLCAIFDKCEAFMLGCTVQIIEKIPPRPLRSPRCLMKVIITPCFVSTVICNFMPVTLFLERYENALHPLQKDNSGSNQRLHQTTNYLAFHLHQLKIPIIGMNSRCHWVVRMKNQTYAGGKKIEVFAL